MEWEWELPLKEFELNWNYLKKGGIKKRIELNKNNYISTQIQERHIVVEGGISYYGGCTGLSQRGVGC